MRCRRVVVCGCGWLRMRREGSVSAEDLETSDTWAAVSQGVLEGKTGCPRPSRRNPASTAFWQFRNKQRLAEVSEVEGWDRDLRGETRPLLAGRAYWAST